jgi:PST family polysaccharide transporter
MLFRTSYKMSDSITRSTGAVYRRAWRQVLYAALVVAGAWIGQHWGISGVAWGTLGALTVNFVLMAELGLDVGHLTWREFWKAHQPAVYLTVVTFPPILLATVLLRHWELPAVVTVIAASVVAVAGALLCLVRAPTVFLGADGQWMLDTMRSFVRKVVARPKPAATPAPTPAGTPAVE